MLKERLKGEKVLVSFKRKDGVYGHGECKVWRFKELWSWFKNRWIWCNVMKIDYRNKVVGEWVWSIENGWKDIDSLIGIK